MKDINADNFLKCNCPYYESNCGGNPNDKLDCTCAKFAAYLGANDEATILRVQNNLQVKKGHKLFEMLQMQKIFASKFHKIDNLTKEEKDHWINAYLVCIEDEIVEAMEFLDIYPEKIKEFDIDEFRKELIDIVHFFMDVVLVAGIDYTDLSLSYESIINCDLHELDILDFASKYENKFVNNSENNLLLTLNYLIRDIRLVRQNISWKHWKKPNDSIDKEKITKDIVSMFRHLIQCFIICGTSSKEIYDIYIKKNVENFLRQEYGYLK